MKENTHLTVFTVFYAIGGLLDYTRSDLHMNIFLLIKPSDNGFHSFIVVDVIWCSSLLIFTDTSCIFAHANHLQVTKTNKFYQIMFDVDKIAES